MGSSRVPGVSLVWDTLPCLMTNDDDKVTKAEFVWLMVQLAAADRDKFRELRAQGWDSAAEAGSDVVKSELPN